jgi:hypothetical protein
MERFEKPARWGPSMDRLGLLSSSFNKHWIYICEKKGL